MENTVENMNENESIKVLVVDDEQDIRTLLNIYLKRLGYEVVEAADGVEGLEVIEKEEIHLAIVDIMMPVMDGLTATKTIRSLERQDAKTIPIIAMTANAFREDAERCMEAGMNAHLAKPLDAEKIKQTISEELRKQNACHE